MASESIRMGAACVAMLVAALIEPAWAQQPKMFAAGDANLGKAMSDQDCVACHRRLQGDADRIYTRVERKVRTPAQLLAQVQRCNAELALKYFPEEEEHVAAYLNREFYKFAP